MKPFRTVCFGECLWDIFPEKRLPGGAPLNVAIHLKAMGIDASLVSRVGRDPLGDELVQFIQEKGVNTTFLSRDPKLPTSTVEVELDENGNATYVFPAPRAWDNIHAGEAEREWVSGADALIYGSLACRESISRGTLFQLLRESSQNIFDVNLRPPFYTEDLLKQLASRAHHIKLNETELPVLTRSLGGTPDSMEAAMQFIQQGAKAFSVCVTRGSKGACWLTRSGFYEHTGYEVQVLDTVGAGDGFMAAWVAGMLRKESPAQILANACAMGAFIASQPGATPSLTGFSDAGFPGAKL